MANFCSIGFGADFLTSWSDSRTPGRPARIASSGRSFSHSQRETGKVLAAQTGRDAMVYEAPAVQYRGVLNEVLSRLFPPSRSKRFSEDGRIVRLLGFIDAQDGNIGWDLDRACRELKLDISGAHAARLFKRCTGLGVREYAKRRRLSLAAERLRITDIPVKTIAAEFGYQSLPHFSRRFKDQFGLSPIEFRKKGQPLGGSC
jgi:AraC-like DNA-binding protein